MIPPRLVPWLLLLVVGLLYANTLTVPLAYDDYLNIKNNATIRTLSPFHIPFFAPRDSALQGRPLVNYSFALNYAWTKEALWSYHLVNLFFHLLASLALYGVVRRTLLNPRVPERYHQASTTFAAVCSLLWAAHPLQTAAVTYVSQRMEVMMGMLFFFSLYAAIRSWERDKRIWSVVAVIACIVGVGCKEVIAVLPVLVLAYDMLFYGKSLGKALKESPLLYGGYALGLGLLGLLLFGGGIVASGALSQTRGVWSYLLLQSTVIVHYLWLVLWPKAMSFDYLLPDVRLAEAAAPGAFLLACLAVTLWAFGKRRLVSYPSLFFFITLAPTSSFMPMMFEACPYRMYLPLAGIMTLLPVGVYEGMRQAFASEAFGRLRAGAFLAIFLAALGYFSVGTASRNLDHQYPLLLWRDVLAKQPDNYRAAGWCAWTLLELNRPEEAIGYYEKVLALRPEHFKAMFWLGKIHMMLEDRDKALLYLEKADKLRPGTKEVQDALAQVITGSGK
jgi:hypothetical protein